MFVGAAKKTRRIVPPTAWLRLVGPAWGSKRGCYRKNLDAVGRSFLQRRHRHRGSRGGLGEAVREWRARRIRSFRLRHQQPRGPLARRRAGRQAHFRIRGTGMGARVAGQHLGRDLVEFPISWCRSRPLSPWGEPPFFSDRADPSRRAAITPRSLEDGIMAGELFFLAVISSVWSRLSWQSRGQPLGVPINGDGFQGRCPARILFIWETGEVLYRGGPLRTAGRDDCLDRQARLPPLRHIICAARRGRRDVGGRLSKEPCSSPVRE